MASPAIAPDGTIDFACDNGRVYALTPAGGTNWVVDTGGQYLSSPAVGVDGTVYVAALSGSSYNLYSLSSGGRTNWSFAMGRSPFNPPNSAQFSSPSIGRDGTLYIGSLDGHIYAIRPNGTTNWVFYLGNSNTGSSSPTVAPDGTIYVGSDLGKVYAFRPDGTLKWTYNALSFVESSAALSADGTTIYIGSLDYNLYALATNGTKVWSLSGGLVSSSPAVGGDGSLYYATLNPNAISAVSSGGHLQWSFTPPGNAFSSPVLGADGTIYAAASTKLYALYGTNALAKSSWPMFRRDPGHNARAVQCALQPSRPLLDGNFSLTLTVETNRNYQVQVSTDFASWGLLTNVTSQTSQVQVLDLQATNSSYRFYRLYTP